MLAHKLLSWQLTSGIVTEVASEPIARMSVFADAVDAIQAVDLAFDTLSNEVDVSKMRIFPSNAMFDKETSGSGFAWRAKRYGFPGKAVKRWALVC